ncbi:MAG: hypothetical protein ACM3TN_06605 [Alphaproteobacteria bacterium]
MHELYDRRTNLLFGAERGIDWFTSHGHRKQRRAPEENSPNRFIKTRFPAYFENMPRAEEPVTNVVTKLGHEYRGESFTGGIEKRRKSCRCISMNL